jgi:hypothetical protein
VPEILGGAALYVNAGSRWESLEMILNLLTSSSLRQRHIPLGLHRARLYTWNTCLQHLQQALTRAGLYAPG